FICTWVGSLALAGIPPFSGFFSKDLIIDAVHDAHVPGAHFAYWALTVGVFVTALYSFRMLFLAFYGEPRMDHHLQEHLKESPWVITLPLVLLAIPAAVSGMLFVKPVLSGDFFGSSIMVAPQDNVLAGIAARYHGLGLFVVNALESPPIYLALAGIVVAWYLYVAAPHLPGVIRKRFRLVYDILNNKYGFDEFNEVVFAGGARSLGRLLWTVGDVRIIDGLMVNGTARLVGWASARLRRVQSGYIYHYAFAIIVGLFLLMTFFLHG
ncbi:MAG: proton-conducting transporter membrane subunit, partial [Acidiferrobacteraceae bacterium]